MPSSNKTTNCNLNQWVDGDKFKFADLNADNAIIDTIASSSGWLPVGFVCAYSSTDSPTYIMRVTGDATALLGVGIKIKLTQTTVKYFIITAVSAYSGGYTNITMYGGTDYVLTNVAISSIYYSFVKTPFGFPTNPDKWTVEIVNSTNLWGSRTNNTWYSPGVSISIPIGLWNIQYCCLARTQTTGANTTFLYNYVTLSTTTSSETNTRYSTASLYDDVYSGGSYTPSFQSLLDNSFRLSLSTKTTYYLLHKTNTNGTLNANVGFSGSYNTSRITATCAYL